MDLPHLLGTQHVDHVFGNQFAHLPDSGESFDHNRIDKVLFLETIEIPDRDLFNHFLPASGISRTDPQEKNVPGGQSQSVCHIQGMWEKGYRFDLLRSDGCDRSLTLPGLRFLDEFAFAT